jgi:DNA-binding NarL/FixJ family response regulator
VSSAPEIRILIADDHSIIRLGLRHRLREQFATAEFAEAENAHQAVEQVRNAPFDVILLDITMPDRSGLDILADLKAAQPTTPILVISMHGEEQFATRALRAGASGYINKAEAADEVVGAVRKVLAGRRYVSEALAERLASEVGVAATRSSHGALSAREFEVLRMIATGRSGKEIAAALSLSYKTVSTYRIRLLQKLQLQTNYDLVEYARREGLTEESGV